MKFRRIPFSLDTAMWVGIGIAIFAVLVFIVRLFWGSGITIINTEQKVLSALSGLPCANAKQRPIAVMMASDVEARPLSGLALADMVFEMPVTPNGITRLMAVYQCGQPKEIGSIRSARQDFIPLAQGLDAILAHWGGEHNALTALNGHVIDNVDAMKYEGSTFYRKSSIPRPHNGFTTIALLQERSEDLGYRTSASMTAYLHTESSDIKNIGTLADTVSVQWSQGMDVRFTYDSESHTYLRWRGGTPEMDATTKEQVGAAVVIVMKTDSTFLYDQYIRVRVTGQGNATIWQNGKRTDARWNKATATDMLTFTNTQGKQIPFVPGTIWVLIDA